MGHSDKEIYCAAAINSQTDNATDFKLLACSGADKNNQAVPNEVGDLFEQAHNTKSSFKNQKEYVGYFPTKGGLETMLYVSKSSDLNDSDHQLLEFFANNIALAYDNLRLRELIRESQKELSYILGKPLKNAVKRQEAMLNGLPTIAICSP